MTTAPILKFRASGCASGRTFGRTSGFSIFELTLAVAFAGIVLAYQARDWVRYSNGLADTRIAAHQREVSKASKNYIRANYATLLTTATATTPSVVTIGQLIAANFLPAGFDALNVARQTACLQVLQPTLGTLAGVVTTEGAPLERGRMIDVALQLGAEGGYVLPGVAAPQRAVGAARTFDFALTPLQVASCSGTPVNTGNLVLRLFFAEVSLPPPYLYSSVVPDNPAANTMTTNLNMGGNNITNVNTINTTGNVTAPCFVSPTNPADLVCPSGNSSINTLTAQQITTARVTDLNDPTKWVDPSATSVMRDVVLTDRTVNLSVKDMLPNVVTYDGYDINMATTGGPQIVPYPPCVGTNKELIHASIKKTQTTLNGVSITHHVDTTPGVSGWVVGIYDGAGLPQATGIVSVVVSCNYKGV